MSYGKRIDTLCSLIKKTHSFADVGCDHGYCSEYVLKNNLADEVIFSDVSKGSLQKAQKLLGAYVKSGKAKAVLGDGFFGVPDTVEQVLIAGMGGSEIESILSDAKHGFMPKYFVFQPMHDSEKLRRYILNSGGYIERDFTFQDGKFYDVIVGGRLDKTQKMDAYSEQEYEFGRENLALQPQAFVARMNKLLGEIEKVLALSTLQQESRRDLEKRKEKIQGALKK